MNFCKSGRWLGDARENLEECTFASAVAADDADNFAVFDLKGDILERPNRLAVAVAVVPLSDLEERVWFASRLCPPDLQVVGERSGANLTQAIGFSLVVLASK